MKCNSIKYSVYFYFIILSRKLFLHQQMYKASYLIHSNLTERERERERKILFVLFWKPLSRFKDMENRWDCIMKLSSKYREVRIEVILEGPRKERTFLSQERKRVKKEEKKRISVWTTNLNFSDLFDYILFVSIDIYFLHLKTIKYWKIVIYFNKKRKKY